MIQAFVSRDAVVLEDIARKIDPSSEVAGALESVGHDPYRRVIPSRIFVGGIPYSATRRDFEAFLARKALPSTDVYWPVDKGTGKGKGFAFVTFPTPDEASRAIEQLDRAEFGGRRLRTDVSYEETNAESQAPPPDLERFAPVAPKAGGLRVFVGDLASSVTMGALAKLFTDCGFSVKDAYVAMDAAGRSRGFGFLTLEPTVGLDDVIEKMNGRSLSGRNLRVGPAAPRK
jgi:nucleolar protein 4